MKPRIIDLFSGVGGLSLGFEMAGFSVSLANEYDPLIAEAYIKNRKNPNIIIEDITRLPIDLTFAPYKDKIDVVVGGPPCQGFSQKGQRKSIIDERNYLFKHFFKVVEFVKPPYFLMENVPNLLTSGNGYFKDEIYSLFRSLGYSIDSAVLNAAEYGVPQNRRRAFILGKLGKQYLPLPKASKQTISIWEAISDLAYLESGDGSEVQDYMFGAQSEYQKVLRNNSSFLYNHIATKHSKLVLERLGMIPPNKGREVLPPEHLTKSIYSGTWTRMGKDEISVTITTRFDTPSSGKFTHPYLNRAITVREAARLQSFPDKFRFWGNRGSQMRQVGNAVPPFLAKAIATVIKNDIDNRSGTLI